MSRSVKKPSRSGASVLMRCLLVRPGPVPGGPRPGRAARAWLPGTSTSTPGRRGPGTRTGAAAGPARRRRPGTSRAGQGRHGKAVPEIVDPGPAPRRAGTQPGGAGQLAEPLPRAGGDEPGAGIGDEEAGRFGFRAERVAPAGVGAERLDRARLQRYLPPAAEFARHDRDHAVVEVDVGPVEACRLPDAHPGGLEQPGQRLV